MTSSAPISARGLSLLMLLGGAITVGAFIPAALPANHSHRKTIAFAVLTVGFIIEIASSLCLNYGIKHHQFADEDVQRLRLNTKSALWKAIHWSVWTTSLVFLLIPMLWETLHSLRLVGCAALMISSTMGLIKSPVAKPLEAQPPLPAPAAPINSDHWGHP